jgi:hypothetical protein
MIMSENLDNFYTRKHRALSRVSWASGVFAWIVLITYLIISVTNLADFMDYSGMGYLKELLSIDLYIVVNLVTKLFKTFFDGVAFFFILKGVSLGLNMILETDLNYRDQE